MGTSAAGRSEGGEVKIVTATHVLIACGTRPLRPDYMPFDGKTVFASGEFIELPKRPRSRRHSAGQCAGLAEEGVMEGRPIDRRATSLYSV